MFKLITDPVTLLKLSYTFQASAMSQKRLVHAGHAYPGSTSMEPLDSVKDFTGEAVDPMGTTS